MKTIVAITAESADELRNRVLTVAESFQDEWNADASLHDLAARLSLAMPKSHRVAFVSSSLSELASQIRDYDATGSRPHATPDPERAWYANDLTGAMEPLVAIIFPGQGSQRAGEHSALARVSATFRRRAESRVLEFGTTEARDLMIRGWPAWEDRGSRPRDADRTDIAQLLLTIMGIGVSETLAAIGVKPSVALGHSVGEFPALYAAGALSAADACTLAARRGVLMREHIGGGSFGLLALRCSSDVAQSLVEAGEEEIYVTCVNGQAQTVLGGTRAGIDSLEERARANGVAATPIPAQGPFHTPLMNEPAAAFRTILADVTFSDPGCRYISTVSGRVEGSGTKLRELIGTQIVDPVLYLDAIRSLNSQRPDIIIQASGGSSLLSLIEHDFPDSTALALGFGGSRQDNDDSLLRNLAQLYVRVPSARLSRLLAPRGRASAWRTQDRRLDRRMVVRSSSLRAANLSEDRVRPTAPSGEASAHGAEAAKQVELEWWRSNVNGQGEAAPTSPAPTRQLHAPSVGSKEQIRQEILSAMSEASGSSVDELDRGGRLAEDLGFDSLLMGDTFRRLSGRIPGWSPETLDLARAVTLEELVERVWETMAGVAPCDASTVTRDDREPAWERSVSPSQGSSAARDEAVQLAHVPRETALEQFPEFQAFASRGIAMQDSKNRIPYYLPHRGIISNVTEIEGRSFISFSSYNYLGLTAAPEIQEAAKAAITRYGTSVSAARILSGNRPIHDELEAKLASFIGTEDAVVLVGGHATNVSVVSHFVSDGDIVFHDALAHDSIQQGISASRAVRHSFPHNDMEALRDGLARRRGRYRRALIAVEGVYSMDGDMAPLPELVELKREFGALLLVDEAHSIGVVGRTGRGICEATGVDPADVDVLMGTLSKALSSCGGYLAGSARLVQYLRYTLSGLVFSAGITPSNTAAALAALKVIERCPDLVHRLQSNADYLRAGVSALGLDCGTGSGTPIVPIIYGDSAKTLAISNALYDRGVSINPILFPAVAEKLTRLRVFVTSEHAKHDMDSALSALEAVSTEFGR